MRQAWGRPDASFASVPDIDEALLRQSDARAADAGHFLIKTMADMTDWYQCLIRKAGYPGLLTQWDMIMRTMEIPARAKMPVIAQHSYFSHPMNVPTKNLVKKSKDWTAAVSCGPESDATTWQASSLNSSYFRAAAAARFLDRPFMITEHSQSCFNRYRHERGLYFGSYAALQGWDSLAAHGVLPVAANAGGHDPIASFENPHDPVSRAAEVVAALAWLRGDVKEAPHSVQLNLSDKTLFPKNFLAAIGDDYAKLAMLTKIGVAYPEVTPLALIGAARADIELAPTEFVPLHVSHWYATVATGGNAFPALLQRLKDGHILTDANQTDHDQRLYQSETGEITLNGKDETMTVVAPRLEGAIIKKNNPVKLGSVEIASCSKPASVVVASLDPGKAIPDAKHLLLVFSTNALNEGMTFENSSMLRMVEVGRLPVLMETAQLSLKLKSAQTAAPAVYALNLDGTRAEEVPCEFKDGAFSLALDTNNLKFATPFFEISFP